MTAFPELLLHPGLPLLTAACLVPFLERRLGAVLSVAAGAASFCAVTAMVLWPQVAPTAQAYRWLDVELAPLRLDKLSLMFLHIFALAASIGLVYGFSTLSRAERACALLYASSAMICVAAGDWVTLFLGWELMAVGSTGIVALGGQPGSRGAAYRYFLIHAAGGMLLLVGLTALSRGPGGLTITALGSGVSDFARYALLAGVLVNAAAVPLHAWLPDAYPRASSAGAVFLSAFTTKTAVYVLARVFPGEALLMAVGSLMAVYGVVFATMADSIRTILSYHIVSQVGYMVAGIGVGSAMAVSGACLHAYAHILYKGLLFMGAGCLLTSFGTDRLSRLSGVWKLLPLAAVVYGAGAVSISGLPLFNGFPTKNVTIAAAFEAHQAWVGIALEIAAVGTFLSVGVKVAYHAFFNQPQGQVPAPLPRGMTGAALFASACCLLTGVFPGLLYALAPYPVTGYHPFALSQVLSALQILAFTAAGFLVMERYLLPGMTTPHAVPVADFDTAYRALGNVGLAFARNILAWLDDAVIRVREDLVTAVRRLGTGSAEFDAKGIDTVVDGAAEGLVQIGRDADLAQSGPLQRLLAWAAVFSALGLAVALAAARLGGQS